MPQIDTARAAYADQLPRYCHTWLQAYDTAVKEDLLSRPDASWIEYMAQSNDYQESSGRYGIARITKQFLLARVAEELLSLRLARWQVNALEGRMHSHYFSSRENDEWMKDWFRAMYSLAARDA